MDTYYIHIPRTGGRSISRYLDINWRGPVNAHITAEKLMENIGREKWDASFTIATVRNPYDRAVSLWASRKRPYDFRTWCQKEILQEPWNVQQNFWTHTANKGDRLVKLILKFENRNQWMWDIPHIGKSNHLPWQYYYDNNNKDLRDVVYNAYKKDFILFDYNKDDFTETTIL